MEGLILLIIAFVLYFIPSLIASKRRHLNRLAIYAANFFLGWTFIGWVFCFIWALTSNTEQNKSS